MADLSSEMRAIGIAAKFAYAFAKAGGQLDTMAWVADDPDRMKRIAEIADEWLLQRESGLDVKELASDIYNPREFFSVGEHNGVRIVSVSGRVELFAWDEERNSGNLSLLPYTIRKDTELSDVVHQLSKLKTNISSSVDHVRQALIFSSSSACKKPILPKDGSSSIFFTPHGAGSQRIDGLPVKLRFIKEEDGWEIHVPASAGPSEAIPLGTRIIVNGSKV